MNILIVDDEIYILRALKSRIHWDDLRITNIFTALNVSKAKEILLSEPIDLLITDIEMPGETGLELMEWVRQANYAPVSACLTCHADFQYAQTAISLGFAEYILKPVDFHTLEETIKKMIILAQRQHEHQLFSKKGKLWEKWERSAAVSFWRGLIEGTAGSTPEEMIRNAEQSGASYKYDTPYTLLLFTPVNRKDCLEQWGGDKELLRYAAANILSEKLLTLEIPERLVWEEDKIWVISDEQPEKLLEDTLQDTLQVNEELLGLKLACYCGESAFGEELGLEARRLSALAQDNTRECAGIFTAKFHLFNQSEKSDDRQCSFRNLSSRALEQLQEGNITDFILLADQQLDAFTFNQEQLHQFIRILFQTIDYYLMSMGKLSLDVPGLDQLYEKVSKISTVQQTKQLLDELSHVLPPKDLQTESVAVRQVKAYIEQHLTERLSRDELAEKVFLSPDYLTRIFRRETGSSLMGYITEKKVEYAKQLLADHPVSEVAQILGYDNFGYFSEIFKRKTGIPPSEFRRKSGN